MQFEVKHFLSVHAFRHLREMFLNERRYFAALGFGFFAANRSIFLRRAARFRMLSLPRLCPIEFCFACHFTSSAVVGASFNKINLNNFSKPAVEAVVFSATASLNSLIVESHPVDPVTALQVQIHEDLRAQHPEWVEPNGESPMCDFYEARLAQLLEGYAVTGSDESAAAVHRALQEEAEVNHLSAA
jgi:hypothetical protein